MLDQDALAQLRGLKTQIESEKERAEGVVRGTTSRFGFARLDDGREVFIPPDEMLKAFPGDRVALTLRQSKDKRPVAEIDALVDSPLKEFTGRCMRKGKALFVQPDHSDISRWLFIPPSRRQEATEGDYLRCRLSRHPIRDGRPQAEVLERVGRPDDPGIENLYTMARHGLVRDWPEEPLTELQKLIDERHPEEDAQREDLCDLAFVTIDAARTQDIDDALYAEVTSEGWMLYVAIADPTAYIDANSALRAVVRERASSVYFHGTAVPMLPESVAQQRCALVEGERRPALVCRVAVSEDGHLGEARFSEALIRSRAKLSYYAVDRYLGGQDDSLICHSTPLEALYQASRALRTRREAEELVMEERQEYRWILDERGHIESIEPLEKLKSQRLVEECMVATNRCAADFLAEHGASGPFVVHDGFRRDRLKDRSHFLQRYLPGGEGMDPDTLEGYRAIMLAVQGSRHELPLRSMLNRLLTRARLSKKPRPHMGMSLQRYTNCTSPLRKYLDFLVHLQIKAVLRGAPEEVCDQNELDALSKRLTQLRDVSQEAERWLALLYLQKLAADDNGLWPARLVHLGQHGFTVRLDANGLEGFVDLRREKEKFKIDRSTGTVKSKTRLFRVDAPVRVSLAGVDDTVPHLALFDLDPASGLKPAEPKQAKEKTEAVGEASTTPPVEVPAEASGETSREPPSEPAVRPAQASEAPPEPSD
ncbi:MAG: VacB/RNase II family 3'-5' exoribonuclease [Halieaceae bacterium]|jgi:ribonuclease R|nr:VacB/RNase II family 3'-5' exoribonuclease [Halieaceae bacterium]